MRERFVRDYGCRSTTLVLTASKDLAAYYEDVARACGQEDRRQLDHGRVRGGAEHSQIDISEAPVSASQLAGLINRVLDGTINNKTAKDLFVSCGVAAEMSRTGWCTSK